MKIPLWLYWEDISNKRPAYIDMCIETVYLHCNTDFDIHMVTPDTLTNYIDMPYGLDRFTDVAHKADYIRYLLLLKYGGMWLDCDMIVLRPLTDILHKLNQYYFISRGNDTSISINFLVAQKCNPIFYNCVSVIQDKIRSRPIDKPISFNWTEIGSSLITPFVKQYDNKYIYGNYQFAPIRWDESILFTYPEDKTPDISNCYTVAISNRVQERNNTSIFTMSKNEILNSPTVFGSIFRGAYNGNK